MTKKDHILNDVEKTMNSLDNWQPVQPDAFFFTRLQARMDKKQNAGQWNWFFESVFLKTVLAVFIVALNLITLLHYTQKSESSISRDEVIESFTSEYALNQSLDS